MYRNAKTVDEKSRVNRIGSVIQNESGKVKSMREALVRARRNGDTAEVRDINEYVRTHQEYQNDR